MKVIKNVMDRLVKANKESFGDVRLDCCKVTKSINYSNTVKNNLMDNQGK